MYFLFIVDYEFYFDDIKYVYFDWSVNDILFDLLFLKFIIINVIEFL